MLPAGSHVKSVFLSSATGCLATTNNSRKLFLDSSTIDVAVPLKSAKQLQSQVLAISPIALSLYPAKVNPI
jgi:3-hydroxyisobutyrate dehydrogenase-like beta-hydroxyacid dehydrogenase